MDVISSFSPTSPRRPFKTVDVQQAAAVRPTRPVWRWASRPAHWLTAWRRSTLFCATVWRTSSAASGFVTRTPWPNCGRKCSRTRRFSELDETYTPARDFCQNYLNLPFFLFHFVFPMLWVFAFVPCWFVIVRDGRRFSCHHTCFGGLLRGTFSSLGNGCAYFHLQKK